MFDGIFWDNDGVLMETEHLYYQANAEVLAQAGVELTLEDFCRISLCQGESVLELAAGRATELRRVRDDIYYRLLGEEARMIPGVRDALVRVRPVATGWHPRAAGVPESRLGAHLSGHDQAV
jgi:beta-phosphoglucomutase-like phosphatase (HAD superfamily)